MEFTWQDVFRVLIILAVGIGGAPVTQLIKAGLSKVFKKPIVDRPALVVSGVVAALLAVAEMLLSGALNLATITVENFPVVFFAVFSVATVYYQWFKNAPNMLGKKGLLRPVSQ